MHNEEGGICCISLYTTKREKHRYIHDMAMPDTFFLGREQVRHAHGSQGMREKILSEKENDPVNAVWVMPKGRT